MSRDVAPNADQNIIKIPTPKSVPVAEKIIPPPSPIQRRNRNNRHRGSKFEKSGADFLDMDVVPYSGSNARFGYGDVRDSKWLGEFKNITIKDNKCKILVEWIHDNIRKANGYNLMPFLAWMPSGRIYKYIILDRDTYARLDISYDAEIEIPKKSVVAVNMFIDPDSSWMKLVHSKTKIVRLKFGEDIYYIMEMTLFRKIINEKGLKGVRQNYET